AARARVPPRDAGAGLVPAHLSSRRSSSAHVRSARRDALEDPARMTLLPLFLRLTDRRVLVVGAGSVAARKIEALLDAGARVSVIAPTVNAEVEAMAVTLHRRPFEPSDVEGAWLVIAATNDSAVNAEIARACEERRVFVNAVDDPPNASAYFGGLIRRGP